MGKLLPTVRGIPFLGKQSFTGMYIGVQPNPDKQTFLETCTDAQTLLGRRSTPEHGKSLVSAGLRGLGLKGIMGTWLQPGFRSQSSIRLGYKPFLFFCALFKHSEITVWNT